MPALPVAMMGVLFPLLAQTHGRNGLHSPATAGLLGSAIRLLLAFWVPALAMTTLLGPWFLYLWVGPELAQHSAPVWQWLAVGIVLNGFAHLPHTLLQSAGRTDLIAKIHLSELLPYGLALWWALLHWGVTGAAVVWTLRVLVDTGLLFACAMRLFPVASHILVRGLAWSITSGMVLAWMVWATPTGTASSTGRPSTSMLLSSAVCALMWCGYHLQLLRPKKP